MDNFTKEQQELMDKPKFIILPAFNNGWVVEVYNQQDEFQGRFNAEDENMLIESIKAAIGNEGPSFGIYEN